MRRAGLIVLGVLVSGCKVVQDAFSAHPASAAEADGQVLTVERLAEIASRVKGLPLESPNLTQLASAYLNYTLFAMSLAKGQSLEDSATVARVMWPMVSQLKFEHYSEKRNARLQLSVKQVDSTYNTGDVRAFQHILIMVPPNAAPPVVQQKQDQANTLWRSLVGSGGANFAAVAKRTSEDRASKSSGGYLDVGGRGRFVTQFEDAAWQLTPGSMSGVVRSSFGFHIIRRPPLAEIRDTFTAGVEHMQAGRSDSTYFATLYQMHKVAIASGAGEAVRSALQDLDAAGRSDKTLATYVGGRFEVKDFVRWLFSIDPRYAQMMVSASDSQVKDLLHQLVERSIALREADSSGVQPTDSEWADIREEYDSTLVVLQHELKLNRAMLHDSVTTDEGRSRLAMARVNDYFDRVVTGQAQFLPIPPLLTQVLREKADWSIDADAVQRAVERATALRASADSLRPSGGGAQMQPAPGPPPVAVPDSGKRPAHRSVP
jgi:parvulin-like peptidyl-prolyl cis-trans isomerase-like protein